MLALSTEHLLSFTSTMPPLYGGRRQRGCLRVQRGSKEYLLADGQGIGEAGSSPRLVFPPTWTVWDCRSNQSCVKLVF